MGNSSTRSPFETSYQLRNKNARAIANICCECQQHSHPIGTAFLPNIAILALITTMIKRNLQKKCLFGLRITVHHERKSGQEPRGRN